MSLRTVSSRVLDLPLSLQDNEAAQIAETMLYTVWVERDSYRLRLPLRYLELDPGDIVEVTVGSALHKVRVLEVRLSVSGVAVDVTGVAADSAVFDPNATGAPSPPPVVITLGSVATLLHLLDLPALRNTDDSPGYYIAAAGVASGWRAASLYRSMDGGDSYQSIMALLVEAVVGSATTALADAPAERWDRSGSVTVSLLTSGASLASDTEINVLNGANAAVLGDEIIQWQTAVDNGDGTWTLSNLLRGRKGTEWATGSHVAGERFVVLDSNRIYRKLDDASDLNAPYLFKAVSDGGTLQGTAAASFTNTGRSLKPYSPVQIAGTRDGSNNLTVTWVRRDRLTAQMLWDVPLSEASESYEIGYYDSAGTTLLRTRTGLSSPTDTYTAAEQTADGITPGSTVQVKIYQISATVGRGYPGEATL